MSVTDFAGIIEGAIQFFIVMTRDQVLKALQQIGCRATEAAQRLDRGTQTEFEAQELRALVHSLRQEIADDYRRLTAGKAQKVLTLFELGVYVPAIEGIWDQADVKGLNTDDAITPHWETVLTEVAFRLSHYS